MTFIRIISGLFLTVVAAVAKTHVRIEGMSGRSERQVLELLGGRLVHVKASPAFESLADDAAFMLRQLLAKDGHAGATVDWKISGRDEIVLIVHAGRRNYLHKVTVNGVDADDAKKLAKIYAKPAEKDQSISSGSPPFREGDVETGLSYIRQELNARGYWKAEAVIATKTMDPVSGAVNITIDARPGTLFQIARPGVTCAAPSEAKLVSDTASPFVGRVATSGNLNTMRLAVEEEVAERGYPGAKIRMSQTLEAAEFIPGFAIALGKRVKLRHIHIQGLERTEPQRIANRMKILEGEWYDEAAMNKRLREFLSTGAFSSARVESSEAGEDVIDATLNFKEAKARELSLSAGFGSYQGFITRATYADRNMFGKLLGFSAGLELGTRGMLGELRITDPWLFGSDISTTARIYELIYGREGYLTYESGIDDKFTWKFGKHYSLDLLAGYSIVRTEADELPQDALGENLYTHPRVRLSQTIDFRENPVLPKAGWHLENALQAGVAVGGVTTSYVMAGLSGGWYHKINKDYDLGIGAELGAIMPSGDSGGLPIDLRLFNGGARTVRSFPERELGPSDKGYATGGEGMWCANFELIRNLTDTVKAVTFFDAGALSDQAKGLGGADVELAAGLGIRLELPIGPVRFEYGYNLTKDPGDPSGAFHFAIGCAY